MQFKNKSANLSKMETGKQPHFLSQFHENLIGSQWNLIVTFQTFWRKIQKEKKNHHPQTINSSQVKVLREERYHSTVRKQLTNNGGALGAHHQVSPHTMPLKNWITEKLHITILNQVKKSTCQLESQNVQKKDRRCQRQQQLGVSGIKLLLYSCILTFANNFSGKSDVCC